MISVTHVIHLSCWDGKASFSGAENHLWILLPALQQAGMHVELIVLLIRPSEEISKQLAILRSSGVGVTTVRYSPVLDWRAARDLMRVFKARRYGVVHTHLDYADLVARAVAWAAGCRHILSSVHNNDPGRIRWKWHMPFRLLDRVTGRYIAISEAVRDYLIQRARIAPHKIAVVPYGIPVPAEEANRLALRVKYHIPADCFVVGYVGRLTAQKNLPLLLEATKQVARRIPDIHCVIVGTGELEDSLRAAVRAEGMDNLQFLGHVERAAELMSAFDVLCLPSQWEGLGLVLLEAMLRRVAIVGSSAGAIPEVLGGGKFGYLFRAGDAGSLANALTLAHDDVQGRKALAERAYHHARESFSVDEMVRRTIAVYEETSARCAGGHGRMG